MKSMEENGESEPSLPESGRGIGAGSNRFIKTITDFSWYGNTGFVMIAYFILGGLFGLIPGLVLGAPEDGFFFGGAAGLIAWVLFALLAYKKIRDRGYEGRQRVDR